MLQRYVFVLANESGQVLDETNLISQKVQQMKNAKASTVTAPKSPSGGGSALGIASAGVGALQSLGAVTDLANSLSSDSSTESGLTQESPSTDWVDLLADAAPVIGAAVGSIVPGVGTAVGTGVGTGISLLNKLLD